jgi:hypothetical protein
MKKWIRSQIRKLGIDIVRHSNSEGIVFPPDISEPERRIIRQALPHTMTSIDRLVSLVHATNFVVKNRIPGSIVECGVWQGGSIMACALTLLELGDVSRDLYLYDTFEGMPEPTSKDRSFDGQSAIKQLNREKFGTGVWCRAGIEHVRENVLSTKYPNLQLHFIQGKVEDTIPGQIPEKIAILRLDTDWYESTKHELKILFPRLSKHGMLIVDDYGHWEGARLAVDEYFAQLQTAPFLHRIDYTGRIAIRLDG